jgi:hypothetical protein
MPPRIPKSKFLELTSKSEDYPEQLKKLRKPGSAGPHLPPAQKRLGRYGYHQYRGPAYIHLHEGRDLYDVFPGGRLTPGAVAAAKAFPSPAASWSYIADNDVAGWTAKAKFPEAGGFPGANRMFDIEAPIRGGKKKRNKIVGFRTIHEPYSWTPHHLITVESLKKGGPFSDDTLTFIEESFWEADNGHNLMVLPRQYQSDCAYHCLLAHIDNHPGYRVWSSAELKKLDARLAKEQQKIKNKEKDQQKSHDLFIEHLVDQLYGAENDFFLRLKEIGVLNVQSLLLTGKGLLGDPLVQGRAGNNNVTWGALG